jgi:hypothetical protein
MHARAIVRVLCVDGPARGLQYLDIDTGRIMFNEESDRLGVWYIYRLGPTQHTDTGVGPARNAHYEYATPAEQLDEAAGPTHDDA